MHLAAEIASQRDADEDPRGERGGHAAADRRLHRPRGVEALRVRLDRRHRRGERARAAEDEPLPVETAYGRSKQEGERLVRESGMPA